jgi:hypothetical protein
LPVKVSELFPAQQPNLKKAVNRRLALRKAENQKTKDSGLTQWFRF